MTSIEEVALFARDYINHRWTRTPERKEKIRIAIRQITGEILGNSCSTCYIEALFKILKLTNMASTKYELKKGVLLEAFGDPSKTCTNRELTDELGDWYMAHYPEKAVYFSRLPRPAVVPVAPPPPQMTILPPPAPEVKGIELPDEVMTPEVKAVIKMTSKPRSAPAKRKK